MAGSVDAVTDAPTDAPTDTPSPVRLDPVPGEWKRVSPKYLVVDLIGTIIRGLIGTAFMSVPYFVFDRFVWLLILPGVAFIVLVITAALTPRRVRSIGYRLRDDDLLFRRGIMFQRFVSVPYGRLQLVDINRGPVARAVGLSELKLVTAAAASNLVIPGLPLQEAEELRDSLVALAESRRAGL